MNDKDLKIKNLQMLLDESQKANRTLMTQVNELKKRNYELSEDINNALSKLENVKNLLIEWKQEVKEKEA